MKTLDEHLEEAESESAPLRPQNSPDAVDKLVNENIKLAHYWANKWTAFGHNFDDMLSLALGGLLKAAQYFDQTRTKGTFGNFASQVIKQEKSRDWKHNSRAKRGGGTAIHISLDAPMGDDADSSTYGDVIMDERDDGAFSALLNSDNAKRVNDWVAKLSERERFVIVSRFGLDCEPLTLEEIGNTLRLTGERVRQIEVFVLKKMAAFSRKADKVDLDAEAPPLVIPKQKKKYHYPSTPHVRALRMASYYRHRDKIRARMKMRYREQRDAIIARVKAYREAHPAACSKRRKRYYYANQAQALAYSLQYYYANREKLLKVNAVRRERDRDKFRAYCRNKSKILTDTYVREQLSKYHPTKSCWEWTPEEVEAKRQEILARRARRLQDSDVVKIKQRLLAGERPNEIAKDYPCHPSTIWNIHWGKYRGAKVAGMMADLAA